ncbi:MAG: ATP-binding protein [Candidatus Aenigmarchaeota archaeon]|nr:ATP-binding protein [Candidatus Aenigmarchaeota archaeon]
MYHEEFKSLLAKLRPVIGDMADAFWLTTLLDPDRQRDIHAVASALAAELLDESYAGRHILLEPPPREKAEGGYPLGTVIYADKSLHPFGLRETDLPQHVAILGRSGAGKTNVGYLLVSNLLRKGKPFTVLDWRGNYKCLKHGNGARTVLTFAPGEPGSLSFNPLDPPPNLTYNQAEAYLRDITSVVCSTYLPGNQLLSTRGVEYFLLKSLSSMMGDRAKPITFNDVRNRIESYGADSRERDWKASALNTLFKLTTGPIGRIINSSSNARLQDLLDRPVILELSGLGSETDRSLFSQAFLLWLYYHRLSEGKSRAFKHALIVEEAHNLFLRRHTVGQSMHDFILRQMRDLGEAIVLLDQNPSLLTTPALGNTGVTICLNLKHANDVAAAGKSLTLPREEWDHIGRLPVGQGIVKMQDRWVKPFLVRFPLFPVVSNFQASKTEIRHSGSDSVKRGVQELQLALNEAISALPEAARKEDEIPEIAPMEWDLLVDIAEHPLAVVTDRYTRLVWNARTGTKIKQTLLERELIKQDRIGVPNGSVTLLKVTEKGRELLKLEGIEVKSLPKNASLEHEYWKHMVAEQYRRKGYTVEEEVPIGNGKAVDLVASKDGRRIAIEIETGKSDVEGNIEKCREAGFDDPLVIHTKRQQAL